MQFLIAPALFELYPELTVGVVHVRHANNKTFAPDIFRMMREADRTKLTAETTDAVLVIEGLPPVTVDDVTAAIAELAQTIAEHCNALTTAYMLNKETPSCELN